MKTLGVVGFDVFTEGGYLDLLISACVCGIEVARLCAAAMRSFAVVDSGAAGSVFTVLRE